MGRLHVRQEAGDFVDGIEEHPREVDEGDQGAERDDVTGDEPATAPESETCGKTANRHDERMIEGVLSRVEHGGAEHLVRDLAEFAEIFRFAHEGLCGAHALDGFIVAGGDLRVVFPDLPRAVQHLFLEVARDDCKWRHDRDHDETEVPIHVEKADRDNEKRADAPNDIEKTPGDDLR